MRSASSSGFANPSTVSTVLKREGTSETRCSWCCWLYPPDKWGDGWPLYVVGLIFAVMLFFASIGSFIESFIVPRPTRWIELALDEVDEPAGTDQSVQLNTLGAVAIVAQQEIDFRLGRAIPLQGSRTLGWTDLRSSFKSAGKADVPRGRICTKHRSRSRTIAEKRTLDGMRAALILTTFYFKKLALITEIRIQGDYRASPCRPCSRLSTTDFSNAPPLRWIDSGLVSGQSMASPKIVVQIISEVRSCSNCAKDHSF